MNPFIQDFIVDYGIHQLLSDASRDAYALDLTIFLRYLKLRFDPAITIDQFDAIVTDDVNLTMLKRVDSSLIKDFDDFLKTLRLNKTSARRRKLTAISAFYGYLCDQYLVDSDPTARLQKPSVEINEKIDYLSFHEAKKLLAAVGGIHAQRDYAIIMLFLTCGLKISQVCDIKSSHYHNSYIEVPDLHLKKRQIPINDACREAIEAYLPIRMAIRSLDGNYLFLSSKHMGLKRRSIYQLVKKHIKAAGLDVTRYSPSSLRHTCAMLLYQENQDLQTVQSILGHTTSASTQIYARQSEIQTLEDAIDNHPLNKPKGDVSDPEDING